MKDGYNISPYVQKPVSRDTVIGDVWLEQIE